MRKSAVFLIYLGLNLILAGLLSVHSILARKAAAKSLVDKTTMVQRLEITDLCIFTESSYTRHLTQANVFTPFQDGPSLPDHFPSGGLVGPPPRLTNPKAE